MYKDMRSPITKDNSQHEKNLEWQPKASEGVSSSFFQVQLPSCFFVPAVPETLLQLVKASLLGGGDGERQRV